jgi:hypothetical protein
VHFTRFGVFSALLTLFFVPSASAAIVSFDFNDSSTTTAKFSPTSVDSNVNSTDFTPFGGGDVSASTDQPFFRSSLTGGADLAGAISAGDYFEFTITPKANVKVNFTSLTFVYGGTTDATGGLDASFAVLASPTGFGAADDLGTFTNNIAANQTQFGTNDLPANVSLSGSAFQDVTGPVTFRIYVWDQQNSSNLINRLDNVVVNGTTTAVPEPTAAVVLLVPAGFALARRRRQARLA